MPYRTVSCRTGPDRFVPDRTGRDIHRMPRRGVAPWHTPRRTVPRSRAKLLAGQPGQRAVAAARMWTPPESDALGRGGVPLGRRLPGRYGQQTAIDTARPAGDGYRENIVHGVVTEGGKKRNLRQSTQTSDTACNTSGHQRRRAHRSSAGPCTALGLGSDQLLLGRPGKKWR